ncbi:MAG TPA: gamma-glutamylcyclotransferase [Lacipirellulaceae bacterium]|nr:gamma-glutamylcyclotransferase [Lacipirellulaceae bacterium]
MHLFTYGTLMFPEVWQAVVGREFAFASGAVFGYKVRRVKNGVYPVMLETIATARVAGKIYLDVDEAALGVLDDFESDFYQRTPVVVNLADGAQLACHAYVLPDQRRDWASDDHWIADEFARRHLAAYLAGLK